MTGRRSRILEFLGSGEPRLVKHAIQRICEAMEADRRLTLSDATWAAVSPHLFSRDVLVRRWMYKLVGLSGERRFVNWVVERVRDETDQENLTWAVAALFAIEPFMSIETRLAQLGLPYRGTPYELSALYFQPYRDPLPTRTQSRAADADDPLGPMWLSLLHARGRGIVMTPMICDLTGHHDPGVSEYAIWALVRSPTAGFADAALGPGDIAGRDAQVRRWLYRLLGKDPKYLFLYADLIIERMGAEPDPRAREGLALGLGTADLDPIVQSAVVEWYAGEADPLVRQALVTHLRHGAARHATYRDALGQIGEDLYLVGSAETDLIFETRSKGMTAIPRIIDADVHRTYLLGLDTVGFSKLTDAQQFAVLRDIYAACEYDEQVRDVPADHAVFLMTGDGVIAGFRGPDQRLLPLQMALRINHSNDTLRKYEMRFGVHAGELRWVVLDNGQYQLVGHAINWTARVMDQASAGQVLVSESYFKDVANPARDYLAAIDFTELSGLTTKHGEAVSVREARQR